MFAGKQPTGLQTSSKTTGCVTGAMMKMNVSLWRRSLVAAVVGIYRDTVKNLSSLGTQVDRELVAYSKVWDTLRRNQRKVNWINAVRKEVRLRQQKPGGFWSQPSSIPNDVTPGYWPDVSPHRGGMR